MPDMYKFKINGKSTTYDFIKETMANDKKLLVGSVNKSGKGKRFVERVEKLYPKSAFFQKTRVIKQIYIFFIFASFSGFITFVYSNIPIPTSVNNLINDSQVHTIIIVTHNDAIKDNLGSIAGGDSHNHTFITVPINAIDFTISAAISTENSFMI